MIAWPRSGLVLLALLGVVRPAGARQLATPKDTVVAAAPLDTALVPIPASEIPTEADRAVTTVVEALTTVGSRARIDEILEGVPLLVDSLG
ncbi:MAG TPA: hypothetical protein VFX50_12865, partial [Gemmatimonadales bacterium]|nr:hypothetical protein [Gemmatimonadales bacterium]